MRIPKLSGLIRRGKALFTQDPNRFLRRVSGVIHVGANSGQERDTYSKFGLHVIWVEPIPEVFQSLLANLNGYPQQRALQYLITDRDDAEYTFHITNAGGISSSILEFRKHKDIWPTIENERDVKLKSITLGTLFRIENIDPADYGALILDVQGAELLVLKGADHFLNGFQFLKIEVPDFESYLGCCQLKDVQDFVKQHGFREFSRVKFAEHYDGGSYYDVVYRRVD